ncbi:MAG: hypothetical protein WD073_04615 [Xanthobacteraceae bacterium]
MSIAPSEIKAILGDIDDARVLQILALNPNVTELEEAAIWATGNGDVLAKSGQPLTGKVAGILDIVTTDEEEEPPLVR